MADCQSSGLSAPWATQNLSSAETYGNISGSSPDWTTANMHGRGRSMAAGPASEFSTLGLKGWNTSAQPSSQDRTLRKIVDGPTSTSYTEPVAFGAKGSAYYNRRANEGGDPTAYRRGMRQLDPVVHPDRPEGKRALPEPYGAPPRVEGKYPGPDSIVSKPSGHASEPPLPRLFRPGPGIQGLRESDVETTYERAMGRKVRVGQDTYKGYGRAGDMSSRYGPTHRPEDDPTFFKSLKDSPTFLRFCDSLPAKPAVSPHDRRAMSLRRAHESEVDKERQLVASLELPDPEDQEGQPETAS